MFPFPLPANAPHTGPAATIFWTLLGVALVFWVIRMLFPTGNQRLTERRTANNNAIMILQSQVEDLQKEIHGLKREVKRMGISEARNREYRHALANQVHALLAWSEVAADIFELMFEEVPDIPHHFHRQIEQMGKPSQILTRYPLPKERDVTDAELDGYLD